MPKGVVLGKIGKLAVLESKLFNNGIDFLLIDDLKNQKLSGIHVGRGVVFGDKELSQRSVIVGFFIVHQSQINLWRARCVRFGIGLFDNLVNGLFEDWVVGIGLVFRVGACT